MTDHALGNRWALDAARRRAHWEIRPLRYAVMGLVVAALLAGTGLSAASYISPLIVLLTCAGAAYALVVRGPAMFWSPLVPFLASSAVYYGFGPLSYTFASDETIAYMDGFFVVNEPWLLSTNALNAWFLAMVALGFYVTMLRRRATVVPPREILTPEMTKKLVALYLAIGTFSAAIVTAMTFGNADAVVPGFLRAAADFSRFGLAALAYLVASGRRSYRLPFYLLLFYEANVALVSLSKLAVLETMIAVAVGYYLARPTRRLLITAGASCVAMYILLVPLVTYARAELIAGDAGTTITSAQLLVAQREGVARDDEDDRQTWWSRLTYTASQAFAMSRYDEGAPGTTLELAFVTLIPRVLWPDKPIITPGREFNFIATGLETSQSAPGIFAEIYWNAGWLAVFSIALGIGVLFAKITTLIQDRIVTQRDLRWLPLALAALRIGYRPDDWFVSVYFSLPLTFLFIGALTLLVRDKRRGTAQFTESQPWAGMTGTLQTTGTGGEPPGHAYPLGTR